MHTASWCDRHLLRRTCALLNASACTPSAARCSCTPMAATAASSRIWLQCSLIADLMSCQLRAIMRWIGAPNAMLEMIGVFAIKAFRQSAPDAISKTHGSPRSSNATKSCRVLAALLRAQRRLRRGAEHAGRRPIARTSTLEPVDYQAGVPPRVVTVPYKKKICGRW